MKEILPVLDKLMSWMGAHEPGHCVHNLEVMVVDRDANDGLSVFVVKPGPRHLGEDWEVALHKVSNRPCEWVVISALGCCALLTVDSYVSLMQMKGRLSTAGKIPLRKPRKV